MLVAVSILCALFGLLVAAAGVAGIARGWVPARDRLAVRRPRLYGSGLLVAALGLGLMAADRVVFTDSGTVAIVTMLLASLVLQASRRPAGGDGPAGGES
ncbi:hypothetical protein GFH48_38620 [Streptomyces fagopyri]|uniref:Uncharacterized protein n=1 Tax=Streptomyces fagopyri TaxID=2662397 RepID=A0A5Q0LMV9_9ACTN|nr:hypothetical protein GFH48_38620 [Streptomyces fagopyri]